MKNKKAKKLKKVNNKKRLIAAGSIAASIVSVFNPGKPWL
jgi:hypothetical protein